MRSRQFLPSSGNSYGLGLLLLGIASIGGIAIWATVILTVIRWVRPH